MTWCSHVEGALQGPCLLQLPCIHSEILGITYLCMYYAPLYIFCIITFHVCFNVFYNINSQEDFLDALFVCFVRN